MARTWITDSHLWRLSASSLSTAHWSNSWTDGRVRASKTRRLALLALPLVLLGLAPSGVPPAATAAPIGVSCGMSRIIILQLVTRLYQLLGGEPNDLAGMSLEAAMAAVMAACDGRGLPLDPDKRAETLALISQLQLELIKNAGCIEPSTNA